MMMSRNYSYSIHSRKEANYSSIKSHDNKSYISWRLKSSNFMKDMFQIYAQMSPEKKQLCLSNVRDRNNLFGILSSTYNVIGIGMDESSIQIYNPRIGEVKTKLKGHHKRIIALPF